MSPRIQAPGLVTVIQCGICFFETGSYCVVLASLALAV